MSYSVVIVRRETEAAFKAAKRPDFFEDPAGLVPFDEATLESIRSELEMRGFEPVHADAHGARFSCEMIGADALLTDRGLYFSASGDGIFEISMIGSEMASDVLAKFDPQEGAWE